MTNHHIDLKESRSHKAGVAPSPSKLHEPFLDGGAEGRVGMKRLLVSVVAAVALVLPSAAAVASDAPPVGFAPCPYPQRGVIVYHTDPRSGTTYIWACI